MAVQDGEAVKEREAPGRREAAATGRSRRKTAAQRRTRSVPRSFVRLLFLTCVMLDATLEVDEGAGLEPADVPPGEPRTCGSMLMYAFPERCRCIYPRAVCTHPLPSQRLSRRHPLGHNALSTSLSYSALTSVLSVGLCISFVEQCTHARTLRTQSPAHIRCTLSCSLRTSLPH